METERGQMKAEMYRTLYGEDDAHDLTRANKNSDRKMGFMAIEEPYNDKKKVNETAAIVRKILKRKINSKVPRMKKFI